ncbi:MAG: type IV secretion system protein [Alphaproteobacteria bacterium]|nr:type IV secretion system protein [Alphaproteobacteria bacterium]
MTSRFILFVLLLVVAFNVMTPEAAYAAESTTDFTNAQGCPGDGFTDRIVTCVKTALMEINQTLTKQIYEILRPTVGAFIVLAVVVFGFGLTTGTVRQPEAEIAMLVIKIGLVIYFLDNFTDWYPKIMEGVEGMLEVVTVSAGTNAISCGGVLTSDMWARVDCSVGVIFGFGAGVTLLSGMLGLIVASAGDSALGFTVFMGGLMVLTTLLFSVFRAVFVYIASMIGITFLLALAPIFVPMVLIKGTTKYFEKWLGHMISYLLQPIFLFGFLSLALAAINLTVLEGRHSLAVTLFGAPVSSYEEWSDKMKVFMETHANTREVQPFSMELRPNGGHCDIEFRGADDVEGNTPRIAVPEYFSNMCSNPEGQAAFKRMIAPVEGMMNFGYSLPTLDVDDGTRLEIFYNLFAIGVLTYILYGFLIYIPTLAVDLTGSAFQHVKIGGMDMPGERQVSGAIKTLGDTVTSGKFDPNTALKNMTPPRQNP